MWYVLFQGRLLSINSKCNHLNKIIIEVINEKKPQSVEHLTKMLKENFDLTEEEIMESVLKLQAKGIIKLDNQATNSMSLETYLKTGKAIWYWMTIIAGAITASMVFTISDAAYPWFFARNVLGIIFVLFLPGYAFTKALFPTNVLAKTSMENLETVTRLALSIGMSIALVSIIGLLLYHTPWGLDLVAIVASLFAFTLVSATIAVIRTARQKN